MSWYEEGLKFECQGSGRCCSSRGEYGYVYMNLADRKRMAQVLKMRTSDFTKKYCKLTDGLYALIDQPGNPDCLFLEGKQCGIYEGRPTQCRTWPFWPENLKQKKWNSEVKSFCPGVGKGKVYSQAEIDKISKIAELSFEDDTAMAEDKISLQNI